MDANGLRFWMLADADQWTLPGAPPAVLYDRERRALRLASRAAQLPPAEPPGAAAAAALQLELVPQALDSFGLRATWNDGDSQIMASGALPGAVPIWTSPGPAPDDLCVGYDGVLYIAVGGGVTMRDLRDRWEPAMLSEPGFVAWRLAADPAGGVWALDRDNRQIGRVQGLPLRPRPLPADGPEIVRPCEEDDDPPRLRRYPQASFGPDETPVGIACSPDGQLALLCWRADGAGAALRFLTPDGQLTRPCALEGLGHPFGMAWASASRIALLTTHLNNEAPVYPAVPGAESVAPVGDYYPLRPEIYSGGPFLHGLTIPPHYPTNDAEGSAPLHHLSLPNFPPEGEARGGLAFDSGSARTVWHRLYLEANLPPACGVRVYLAADDAGGTPAEQLDWHEHQFGEVFRGVPEQNVPLGAWAPQPSEIAHHPGLICCPQVPGRAGLFSALIQRPLRKVRALRGRYLYVRVVLSGDRRSTPELWALRAYASRFSYVDNYLPELYQESLFGPDADAPLAPGERSTPADFLERFVHNFEGVLTIMEDRVAQAHLLSAPRSAPPEALEWLAGWVGIALDPAYGQAQRRRMIEAAPALCRQRGTLRGLQLALDIATDDAVSGGEIIVIENWRMRQIFATILGADLADEENPLLAGLAVSGNSYVGDTLFLGDENNKEFLALFSAELAVDEEEADAIAALFDRLAYRVTLLVHEAVTPQDHGLIRRVAALETPAHVIVEVKTASGPFMVALRALVGIDSYLSDPARPGRVRLGASRVGVRDLIQSPPAVDPRFDNGS